MGWVGRRYWGVVTVREKASGGGPGTPQENGHALGALLGEGPGKGFVAQGCADDQMPLCARQRQRRCALFADLMHKAEEIGPGKAPARGEGLERCP